MTQKNSATLILYSTVDGHTKAICDYIGGKFKEEESITISSIEEANKLTLNDFKKIIIGASVRYGNHRQNVYDFIESNITTLNKVRNGFFSVNLTARKPNKDTPETNPYLKKFLKKTNWEPNHLGVFAGRLDYPSYDCINKLAILLIMVITNGPKDISQTYELTNWGKVDDFIKTLSN